MFGYLSLILGIRLGMIIISTWEDAGSHLGRRDEGKTGDLPRITASNAQNV